MAQRPHFRAAFGGILDLPVPAIAAVHGFALGGGLELALSCDLMVCDETAVLGLPEVTVGVIPGGGGTQLLVRRVGAARAADLVFTGRKLDVAEADRLGLVDRRVAAGTDREVAWSSLG
jgi:enoyl-CoA hydratase/carnithine racemase